MKESESRFRGWLLRETGIDPDSLGNDFLTRALTERVHALQADGERLPSAARPPVTQDALDAYWQQLNASADERRALIELFVVPETGSSATARPSRRSRGSRRSGSPRCPAG